MYEAAPKGPAIFEADSDDEPEAVECPVGCICDLCEPGDVGYAPLGPRDTIPDAEEVRHG